MLIAMGSIAMRHDLDMTDARIDVSIAATDKPVMRFSEVDIEVTMPSGLSKSQRAMLERAADGCPIKHSFGSDIPVKVWYSYPP